MFDDRADAGRRLAKILTHLGAEDVVVVGLPRGGVPVAYEVAHELGAPLDLILVRKLGVPAQPELGMGAIGEDGVLIINQSVLEQANVTEQQLTTVQASERSELARRVELYRKGRSRVPLRDRVVLIIDDGIATGSTARAACEVARAEGARRVILAVPVGPIGWTDRLAGVADELIALTEPDQFSGVGQFYSDFTQTSDEQVISYLDRQD